MHALNAFQRCEPVVIDATVLEQLGLHLSSCLIAHSMPMQVAVALGASVYLWNANTGDIEQLMECSDEDDYVTSVSWGADGKHIAVGTSSSAVQIWDANRVRQIR